MQLALGLSLLFALTLVFAFIPFSVLHVRLLMVPATKPQKIAVVDAFIFSLLVSV